MIRFDIGSSKDWGGVVMMRKTPSWRPPIQRGRRLPRRLKKLLGMQARWFWQAALFCECPRMAGKIRGIT